MFEDATREITELKRRVEALESDTDDDDDDPKVLGWAETSLLLRLLKYHVSSLKSNSESCNDAEALLEKIEKTMRLPSPIVYNSDSGRGNLICDVLEKVCSSPFGGANFTAHERKEMHGIVLDLDRSVVLLKEPAK